MIQMASVQTAGNRRAVTVTIKHKDDHSPYIELKQNQPINVTV